MHLSTITYRSLTVDPSLTLTKEKLFPLDLTVLAHPFTLRVLSINASGDSKILEILVLPPKDLSGLAFKGTLGT